MDFIFQTERLKRVFGSLACFIAAVLILYRGNNPADPHEAAFIVPVMCTFTALALGATGLTLALRANAEIE